MLRNGHERLTKGVQKRSEANGIFAKECHDFNLYPHYIERRHDKMIISQIKPENLSRSLPVLAVFICIILLSHPALGQITIDPGDWFILASESYWRYTGDGQPNTSVRDNFTNTVPDEKTDAGNGIMAVALEMGAYDERDGDRMFWHVDSEGALLFCGFHNETADESDAGSFPAQDVFLDDPLLVGEKGQAIGDEVTDTGESSVKVEVSMPFVGTQVMTMDATVTSSVTYKELIPRLETPIGIFTDVLRMIVELGVNLNTPVGAYSDDLFSGEFWLKKGVGMVFQKQYADDPADEKSLIIEGGKVGGAVIQAENRESLTAAILILQTLCGGGSEEAGRELDTDGDDRAGLAEAIYLLGKLAGTRPFTLESSAFSGGSPIPEKHTADGDDVSPALSWKNAPMGTGSFALIIDDPDAIPVAEKVWDHWIVYDIPASTASLDENAGAEGDGNLPAGAKHGANSWENAYYQGPSPPRGTVHRYYFRLYALDIPELNPAGSAKADIETAMKGHILGATEFMGTYIRPSE